MAATSYSCPEGTRDIRAPAAAADFSRFVQRIRRRYAAELPLLAPGAPVRASMDATFATLRASGLETGAALRVLRQLVMERLVVLDCEGGTDMDTGAAGRAPLKLVTRAMTELAELALDVAMVESAQVLDGLYGQPQGADGQRAAMWVIGMGKLGARELNVSSDIDLIYVYDQDGETAGRHDGRGQISNHEYFSHQVKAVYSLIGDTTEHGFVFRVDLALRPNGNSGPAAVSLSALEEYLQAQGREWERFAWLKSRVVAPEACIASGSAEALRAPVLPFVFRRYLD
ncbi:MAG: glutamine-synthetase adenylyltransferase, partial [Comamonadaceae bacterium]